MPSLVLLHLVRGAFVASALFQCTAFCCRCLCISMHRQALLLRSSFINMRPCAHLPQLCEVRVQLMRSRSKAQQHEVATTLSAEGARVFRIDGRVRTAAQLKVRLAAIHLDCVVSEKHDCSRHPQCRRACAWLVHHHAYLVVSSGCCWHKHVVVAPTATSPFCHNRPRWPPTTLRLSCVRVASWCPRRQ